MLTMSQSLLLLAAATAVYGLWKVIELLIEPWTSTLRYVPGPPSSSWLEGYLRDFRDLENWHNLLREWIPKYGIVLKLKGPFNVRRILPLYI